MIEIKFDVMCAFPDSENFSSIGTERLNKDGNWEYMRSGRDAYLLGTVSDNQGNAKFIRRQYTGLKDKNGVEIYEGDIVKAFDPLVIKCGEYGYDVRDGNSTYKEITIGWYLYDQKYKKSRCLTTIWGKFDYEVVGNIYENPELLEANK